MIIVVVQWVSCVWLFAIPWTIAYQASLSFTISWSLLKLMSIKLVMPSDHPILCRPLLLLPSVFPSIRVFSNESVLHIMWPKYWSFSISSSNEYSGMTSFRIDWFDPLAVQGTLNNTCRHGLQAWLCDFPWTTECEHKNRMFHKHLLLLLSSQSENTEQNHN